VGGGRCHEVPSTTKPMAFKDVVRNNASSSVGLLPSMPNPYIVEKTKEVLSLEVIEPNIT
jgi:hypothetical protein